MSQVSQLSPELARGVLQLARALLVAARNWTLYPPEHPTVGLSVGRFTDAIRQSSMGAVFSLGITPDTLMVEGTSADPAQSGIAEAARLLHDCDLLRVTFVGDVPTDALHAFLRVVTLDPAERRQLGGPATIWATQGTRRSRSSRLTTRRSSRAKKARSPSRPGATISGARSSCRLPAASRRSSTSARRSACSRSPAARSTSPTSPTAAMAPKRALDGSPMITSQAATVLAAFRHLTSIVGVMAPERMPEVMSNLATAATQLDPHVVMQVLQTDDDPAGGIGVVRGVARRRSTMRRSRSCWRPRSRSTVRRRIGWRRFSTRSRRTRIASAAS